MSAYVRYTVQDTERAARGKRPLPFSTPEERKKTYARMRELRYTEMELTMIQAERGCDYEVAHEIARLRRVASRTCAKLKFE
jgi:hypothetical protein